MNESYIKGRAFEHYIINTLRKQGYYVYRLASSKPFDLIAVKLNKIYAIECKSYELSYNQLAQELETLKSKIPEIFTPLIAYKDDNHVKFFGVKEVIERIQDLIQQISENKKPIIEQKYDNIYL